MIRAAQLAILPFFLTAVTQGATVSVSSGFGSTSQQGVTLETTSDHSSLVDSSNYLVAVGRYSGGTFTPWGGTAAVNDNSGGSPSREVTGSFTTSSGGQFDGLGIQVFVGLAGSVAAGTGVPFTPDGRQWVVFGSTSNPLFPVSTTSASVVFNMNLPSFLTIVASGSPDNVFNGGSTTNGSATNYFFMPVPEPSAALLGAVGMLGFLRRRRA